ncbi:MAG TPA: ferric reductase-like transmembrane domain-containing protein [Micromonosporaceae bacterium]|nr:ferric reductase-like transmembrane domain-containing protein [Micromonosporaceae bacterium]
MRSAAESVHLVAATAGFVALGLLWLCVIWGTVLRSGWAESRIKHSTLYMVHMVLALTALTLSVVHALTQMANPVGTVRWIDEVVPFTNPVDPIGIGFGVLGLEIIISLALSVAVQRRLGFNRWRGLHSLAYMAFTLISAHVLISGSDVWPIFVWLPVVLAWAITMLAGLVRVVGPGRIFGRRLTPESAEPGGGRPLRVEVDPTHCARFGFCEHEAPEVFRLRSDGMLQYRSTVPAAQADAAARAAAACPARAIMLGPRTDTGGIPVLRDGDPARSGSGRRATPLR